MTEASKGAVMRNRLKTWACQQPNIILLVFGVLLTLSTVVPVVAIVRTRFLFIPERSISI